MSHLEARLYDGANDLNLLLDFVRNATQARWPRRSYLHVGDVVWRLAGTLTEPGENLRLWLRAGRLVAFAWLDSPENFEADALPELASDPLLADELLEWVVERRRALGAGRGWWDPELERTGSALRLVTNALDADESRIALLARHGYERIERHELLLRRSLDTPIPESPLPAGVIVRHVTDADVPGRVATHVDAWEHLDHIGIRDATSGLSAEAYRQLRAAPVYDPELDLVVAMPSGAFASCCICWMDEISRVGFFEPVGSRAAYRRQGLARALILEGLRRLRARGAHAVNMGTASINAPAAALYQSCGFRLDDCAHWYVKQLSPGATPGRSG